MNKIGCSIMRSLIAVLAFLSIEGRAQKVDSLGSLREFITISSAYQKAPLYLEIEMKNSTNYFTNSADTISASGKIYLMPELSYMQFDEIEQLISDSLSIMISSKMQRIIVNSHSGQWRLQMEKFSGSLLKENSIEDIAKRYRILATENKPYATIELTNREFIGGSTLSKETIVLNYDAKNKRPINITSIRRILIPLLEEEYHNLKLKSNMEGYLLANNGKGFFLIKEQALSFTYKIARQDSNIKIPVTISDRIIRNGNGEFEPAKAFQEYQIIIN